MNLFLRSMLRYGVFAFLAAAAVLVFSKSASSQQWTGPDANGNTSNSNAGNVGVGTTSPAAKLQVNSSVRISPFSPNAAGSYLNQNAVLSLINGNIYQNGGNEVSTIRFGGMYNPSGTQIEATYNYIDWSAGWFRIRNNQQTKIQIGAGDEWGRQDIYLNPTGGNVGIGTTSPDKLLTVQGSSNRRTLKLVSDGDGVGYSGIDLAALTNTNIPNDRAADFFLSMRKDTWYGGDGSGPSFIIETGSRLGNNFSAPFTITPTNDILLNSGRGVVGMLVGNVGIGTPTPGFKLDVAGYIRSTVGFIFPDGSILTSASAGGGGGTITAVNAGTGLSGGGSSGSVSLSINAGTGLSIVSNSLTNNDRGSSQAIFKNIAAGANQFSATGNSDTITFVGSGGTSVSVNQNKQVIIDGSTSIVPAANVTPGTFGTGNYTIAGDLTVNGNIKAKYQDVAEWVPSSKQLPAGTVVILDSTKSNQVTSSTVSYDTRVAGVISEQPGITLGERAGNKVLVATTGRVRVMVDATKAPIKIGDLLVTSDIPGVAMKSEPLIIQGRQIHAPGTLIGKALEPLEKGSGSILVLLSLQ